MGSGVRIAPQKGEILPLMPPFAPNKKKILILGADLCFGPKMGAEELPNKVAIYVKFGLDYLKIRQVRKSLRQIAENEQFCEKIDFTLGKLVKLAFLRKLKLHKNI
jgi:hypothetical protein